MFVDGANFYQALRRVHVRADDVDIEKVARKLARGRSLEGVCYFIARVDRDGGAAYEANRRLIAAGPVIGQRLREACDATIRLERDWFRDCLR